MSMNMRTAASPSPLPAPLQQPDAALADRIDAIVIGASAGGVEALGALLPAVPARLRAAIMIVLHIPRDRPSLLADIFTHKCVCPVREALDKEPIESGTVYFAPPDYHLLVDVEPQRATTSTAASASDGVPHLALSIDEQINYSRPAIDVLFESAADAYKERLLGIILTGANDDGAAGLAAIHQRGGITIVQDPASAQTTFMPQSALRKTPAARVLTLEQIAVLFRDLAIDHPVDQPHAR